MQDSMLLQSTENQIVSIKKSHCDAICATWSGRAMSQAWVLMVTASGDDSN